MIAVRGLGPLVAVALASGAAPSLAAAAAAAAAPPAPIGDLRTAPRPNDDGHHIVVTFEPSPTPEVTHYEIRRAGAEWKTIKILEASTLENAKLVTFEDEVQARCPHSYSVRALVVPPLAEGKALTEDDPLPAGTLASIPVSAGPERPVAAWFDRDKTFILVVVVAMAFLLSFFLSRTKKQGKKVFIRRIAGIDAMEEAIGRSTEMGRPVLYVPGIDEIQNIQTVASLLILGHVAEMVARYDTQVRVPCMYPLNMIVAEEIVRQGFYTAGRPDAHRPQNIQFVSSEQFAFCAGVAGIILREKPATNIYLGRFFAESLILAETGYVNKSIQIGGTAEITQLPFFIAACDYTIIGEELYAVSAYLSREPRLTSSLKATDAMKLGILALLLVGTLLNTFGVVDLGRFILP